MRPPAISVLLIVNSDPRTSARPAEAVRVAAGLSQSDQVQVTIYLRAAARLVLSLPDEDLVNGDVIRQFLPLVAQPKNPILYQASDHENENFETLGKSVRSATDGELARTMPAYRHVLGF
jgi:hypothetical protein